MLHAIKFLLFQIALHTRDLLDFKCCQPATLKPHVVQDFQYPSFDAFDLLVVLFNCQGHGRIFWVGHIILAILQGK